MEDPGRAVGLERRDRAWARGSAAKEASGPVEASASGPGREAGDRDAEPADRHRRLLRHASCDVARSALLAMSRRLPTRGGGYRRCYDGVRCKAHTELMRSSARALLRAAMDDDG